MQLLSNLDLAKNELRQAALHNLTTAPASPVVGQVWYDTTNKQAWICTNATGPVWAELTNNYNMGGNTLTNLGAPTNNTDAATKLYVDASRQGLAFKDPVRIATTANLTSTYAGGVLTSTANGTLSIDSVGPLALNDRVLVKDQTDQKQNGIYYVSQVGVAGSSPWKLTRATDADGANEVVPGAFVFVLEGTTNSDTAFVCSNNTAIILDTSTITFSQFASVASLSAGNGLTKTGNTIDVVGTANRVIVSADAVDVSTSLLPTPGAGDAGKALVATGTIANAAWTTIVQKKTFTITGTGAATVFTLNHALNTLDVQVAVYDANAAGANQIMCDVQVFDTNNVKVTITPALANAVTYRAVVVG